MEMSPIFYTSIFLLLIAIISQYTESSPKVLHFHNLLGKTDNDHEPKVDSTRILLYDRALKKWVYLPRSLNQWNEHGALKFIIHGFNPLTHLSGIPALKAQNILILGHEYAKKNSSINVAVVDWTRLATKPVNQYGQAAENTRSVAKFLTHELLHWKRKRHFRHWKEVHIIGFSLGAHIAGMIGFQVMERTGKKIGRITGIDPAGPRFSSDDGQWPEDISEFLDYTDARFVDIVHCNMGSGGEYLAGLQGTFGSVVKAGHVDFYPNGGSRQPYTCNPQEDRFGCSHNYCVMLMAAGVKNVSEFPMCPCSSWDSFLSGNCDCLDDEALCVGDEANKDFEGGPRSRGYYGVVTAKLSQDYFRMLAEDDIELF